MQNIRFLNKVILSLLRETDIEYKSFFNVKELYLNTPLFVYSGSDRSYGRYDFLVIDLFDSMGFYRHLPGHLESVYGLVNHEDGFDEVTYVISTYYSLIMEMPEVRKVIIKKYPDYYPPNTTVYRYNQLVKELESNSL